MNFRLKGDVEMALRKIGIVFLLSVLFTTCAGLNLPFSFLNNQQEETPSAETPFLSSFPERGSLVFIGAAGRRSNSDETLFLALLNAAERVEMFKRVSGEYAIENYVGSGAFDYTYNTATSLTYNKEGASQYIDSLKYDPETDTMLYENTLFVRTVYSASLSSPVNYKPVYKGQDKKPTWIESLPEIDGYEVVVGVSRRSLLSEAYNYSRDNAIFSAISIKNTQVQHAHSDYYTTEHVYGYKVDDKNITYSYGTLTGFYVLDTWVDPKDKTVWTLAIAIR